jgi:hypothetical protein
MTNYDNGIHQMNIFLHIYIYISYTYIYIYGFITHLLNIMRVFLMHRHGLLARVGSPCFASKKRAWSPPILHNQTGRSTNNLQ